MSDLWKIALTSSLTVIGGIFVLAVGQLLQRFFIEPIQEQAKVIGEIVYTLAYYGPVYANPGMPAILGPRGDLIPETEDALRQNASRLLATTAAVRWYGLARTVRTPSRNDVLEAAHTLIGLSNSIRTGSPQENIQKRDLVLRLLRIKW